MTHFKGVKVVIKKGWTSSSPRMIEKDIKKYVSATQKFEVTLLNLFQDILADKPTFSVISRWILTKILKQDLADKSASSKLRIVGRSSVTKYLARHRNPPNIGIFLEDSPKLFSRKKVIPKLKKLLAKNDLSYSDLYESQSASLDSKNSINSLLKSLILSVNLSAVKPCQLEYVSKCKRYKFVSCSMSYNISYLESFFKRDKNEPLYKLYNILNLEAKKAKGVSFGDTYGSVGVIYSKIYKLFTEIYKKKIKMDNQNVAHYCKKLEKQGFIICTILQQNSERKIFLRSAYFRKYLSVAYGFLNDLGYFDKLLNRKVFMDEEPHQGSFQKLPEIIVYPLSYKPEEEQKEEVQEEEASSTISPVIDIDFNEMTIREWIINLVNNPQKYLKKPKKEGLTISEIAEAIGLNNEEKLVSRILSEIMKKNSWIKNQAFRLGKIFLYKFYSTRQPKVSWYKQENSEPKLSTKIEVLEAPSVTPERITQLPKPDENPLLQHHPSEGGRQVMLNEECMALVRAKSPRKEESDLLLVREYFKTILRTKNKKRPITIDTINRYIYTLNLVYSSEVISMIDLKNRIKTELEKGFGWEIDNKTIKSIAKLLKDHGLISTYEFNIWYLAEDSSSQSEDSEEEYVEDYSDDGDDPNFKIKKVKKNRKRERKDKAKSRDDTIKAKHSKTILTKIGISKDDPRIRNDPSITNPSLRQDKELPDSVLRKMIEFKQKQEIKNKEESEMAKNQPTNSAQTVRRSKRQKTKHIDDLIIKAEPSLEQKLLIQSKCAYLGHQNGISTDAGVIATDSQLEAAINGESSQENNGLNKVPNRQGPLIVQSSAVNMLKFVTKMEKINSLLVSSSFKKFKNFVSTSCIHKNKILEEICQWYGYTFVDKNGWKTEVCHTNTQSDGYFLTKITHMMDNCDSFYQLENIETYEDITIKEDTNTKPKEIRAFKNIQEFFSLPLQEELHDYLKSYPRKNKKITELTNEDVLKFTKNWLRKLYKGIDVSVQELRQEFNWNSTLVQVLCLMEYMGIIDIKKGIMWFATLREAKYPEFG